MRGAGGTPGGSGRFVLGLVMLVAGGYLLLSSITITSHFGFGHGLFSVGSFRLTTGMVMIPFIFGIGLVFYNYRLWVGWALAGASLVMLVAGVIASIRMSFHRMSAFDLIMIFVLLFGGIGLFASSLRSSDRP